MRKQQANKKLNNAGFSLVELLVGVMILAIISIPMLKSFGMAAKMNAKSKKALKETTVAQDIMEGLKAYNKKELDIQFNPGAVDEEDHELKIIDSTMVHGGRGIAVSASEFPTATGIGTDGVYYYYMKQVEDRNEKDKFFDVLIKLDATPYMEGSPNLKGDPSTGGLAFNNTDFASIGGVNGTSDGNYSEPMSVPGRDGVADKVIKECIDAFDLTYYDEETGTMKRISEDSGSAFEEVETLDKLLTKLGIPKNNLSRVIDIKVEKGTGYTAEEHVFDAEVTFTYTFKNVPGYTNPIDHTSNFVTHGGVDELPISGFTGDNFYLFYYPLYLSGAGTTDTINIDLTDLPIDADNTFRVYVVKQYDNAVSDALDEAALRNAENTYRSAIKVATGNVAGVRLRTNIGQNLADEAKLNASGTFPTKELEKNNAKSLAQLNVGYGTAITTATNHKIPVFGLSGGLVKESGVAALDTPDKDIQEVIYDVTVSVFDEGKGFTADSMVYSIEGSMNN